MGCSSTSTRVPRAIFTVPPPVPENAADPRRRKSAVTILGKMDGGENFREDTGTAWPRARQMLPQISVIRDSGVHSGLAGVHFPLR